LPRAWYLEYFMARQATAPLLQFKANLADLRSPRRWATHGLVAEGDDPSAALLLVGHGSVQNPESCRTVYLQAAHVRELGRFAMVREGFLRQTPFLVDVLAQLATPRVVVVPFFISEGYFTEQVIPRELGLRADGQREYPRSREIRGRMIHYARPIGTHPSMTGVLLSRAHEVVKRHPFPCAPPPHETALFIAGHGTAKDENSRAAIETQVRLIRSRALYAEVHAVFLEEPPAIGQCYEMAHARNVVLVPFFAGEGLHVREDIPVLLGEPAERVQERLAQRQPSWRNPTERHGKRLWYADSIGSEPLLAQVILERAREATSAQR
jgi:sirohydrochlorin cobaltochelatase